MAKRNPVDIHLAGRLVGGSLYQGSTTDDKGQPLVYKSGAKAGQPRMDYSFGVAVPKTQAHWGSEPGWGATLWAEGHASWPNGQAQRHDFAWKVVDGDSTMPNKKGVAPNTREGYPGHWVVWFSGTTPPQVAKALGIGVPPTWEPTPNFCMPGDYVEVKGSISSNESDQTAGMYINYAAVCMRGYGDRISSSFVDLATAGFGGAPLPAGASVTPLGNAQPPVPTAPAATPSTAVAPPVPAAPAAVPLPTPVAPPAAVVTPPLPQPVAVPVVPNPAILGAPSPVVAPPAPAALPVPVTPPAPAKVLKNGGDYAAHIAAGWTDALLQQHGLL